MKELQMWWDLEEKFKKIIDEEKVQIPDKKGFMYRLLQTIEDYFKQTGKQGGNSTKKKHPNHFKVIGKKGARKRWGKHTHQISS